MHEDDSDIGSTLILKGIRRLLGQARRQIVVGYPSSNDLETVRQFADSIRSDSDIDGIILWASGDACLLPVYRSLAQSGKSLVCIDRKPPGALEADVVAVDHFRGGRTATEHLINLGHRRIGMVANDDRVSSVRDRRDGYFSALRDAGIPWDEDLLSEVSFVNPKDLKPSVERVLDRYLALASPPTALFAVNDQIAMYLQDALLSRGLSVPGDISLVGFDWFLRWLPSGGDLTTVAQPFEKIGEVAAKRLLDRIEGSDCHDPRNIFLSAPLIVKSSTRNLVPSSDLRSAHPPLPTGCELH
jgi:LacI family transcriptional regulator